MNLGLLTDRQETLSSTITTQDWVQVSKGFFLLAYIPGKSLDDLSNESSSSDFAQDDPDSITKAMNAICEKIDTRLESALAVAAHRTLARSEW